MAGHTDISGTYNNPPPAEVEQPVLAIPETKDTQELMKLIDKAASLGYALKPDPIWLRNYEGKERSNIANDLLTAADSITRYIDWNDVVEGNTLFHCVGLLKSLADELMVEDKHEPIQEMPNPVTDDSKRTRKAGNTIKLDASDSSPISGES